MDCFFLNLHSRVLTSDRKKTSYKDLQESKLSGACQVITLLGNSEFRYSGERLLMKYDESTQIDAKCLTPILHLLLI